MDRLGALPEGETRADLIPDRRDGRRPRVAGGRTLRTAEGEDGARASGGHRGSVATGGTGGGLPGAVPRQRRVVQVVSSNGAARDWVPFGKFSVPVAKEQGKFDPARFAEALAEGIINRLVRAQSIKGPREKGKLTYGIRIDNVSPLNLNGLAVVGYGDKPGEDAQGALGDQHRASEAHGLPATEEAVKAMGLKQGIRVTAAGPQRTVIPAGRSRAHGPMRPRARARDRRIQTTAMIRTRATRIDPRALPGSGLNSAIFGRNGICEACKGFPARPSF